MIKAQELRIGNRVFTDSEFDKNGESVVYTIYPSEITVRTNGVYRTYNLEDISGIPLTPEVLEQYYNCVVGDSENCNISYTNDFKPEYWIQYHTDVCEAIFYGKDNSIEKPITHLHQLQNLYYALIGTEITYNPK